MSEAQPMISENLNLKQRALAGLNSQKLILASAGAVGSALILGGLLFLIAGADPVTAYSTMLNGAFGSTYAIGQVLKLAVPLLIISLGLLMVFRANLWNIGAEGQLLIGALTGGVVAIEFPIASGWIAIPVAIIAGAIGGGVWAGVVGWLRAKWEVHEVITSLLLNFVAVILFSFMVRGPLRDPFGFLPESKEVPEFARLPSLPYLDVNIGIVLALMLVALFAYVLKATPYGLKIRMVGSSPSVARAVGVNPSRMTVELMFLSGALAGIAGVIQVLGVQFNLQDGLSPGFGFTAILVALLGRMNPIGAVFAALALAAITVGGSAVQVSQGVPTSIVATISALLVMCLLIAERISQKT